MNRFPARARRCAGIAALLLATCMPAMCMPALAATRAGVSMPDTVTVDGALLRLNGMGVRSFTFLEVHGFVAGLYVAQPSHDAATLIDAAGPKLLRIVYVHAAGVERVRQEFLDTHARLCGAGCPKADDADFARLLATARPVRPGDVTTYVYDPDGALHVLFNGSPLATFHNPGFARRSLESMIGAHPPTVALRRGLLGN